jgi:hypothetical protein
MFRYYFLSLAAILFCYGLYVLITGRFLIWFARSYYSLAEGNIVRWFGLSIIAFTTLLGISLIDMNLLDTLLPYTLVTLFIASIMGPVVQSRANLIKKDTIKK